VLHLIRIASRKDYKVKQVLSGIISPFKASRHIPHPDYNQNPKSSNHETIHPSKHLKMKFFATIAGLLAAGSLTLALPTPSEYSQLAPSERAAIDATKLIVCCPMHLKISRLNHIIVRAVSRP
jgi:hypothetical protein